MTLKAAIREIEFDQYITPDGEVYNLNGVQGRFVMSHTGMGLPPIEYVTQRGPFQHGETPLGFRLNPRYIQYIIRQQDCSRQGYWDLRSVLLDTLRPNRQIYPTLTPGTLRKILPNGEKRDINVFIESGLEFSPRQTDAWDEWGLTETIRFVAHDPLFFNPIETEVSYELEIGDSLVFGVDESTEKTNLMTNPSFETGTTGWSSANTISRTDDIAYVGLSSMKIEYVSSQTLASYDITLPTESENYVMQARVYVPTGWSGGAIWLRTSGFSLSSETVRHVWWANGPGLNIWTFIDSYIGIGADSAGTIEIYTDKAATGGDIVYVDAVMVEEDSSYVGHPYFDGSVNWAYWNGTEHASTSTQTPPSKDNPVTQLILPTTFAADAINEIVDIEYTGTWLTYPEIVINGPISYPVITNLATNEKLMMNIEVEEGQSIIFDLRYGHKSVTDRYGNNYIAYLAPESDLATFHIAPEPEAEDGVNSVWVAGSLGKPGVTGVVITYNTRYIGI